ncbi:BTB/POZ domain-containing adapter for CUL3-mediated RhoA degradation protein 1 isoform 1 [Aphelenchoides avenae]|nr:BTB/POZ domain-containing adapter for CUL3-mediated RhoA degradation protein 1 isoform 1 [Aphelenchus avenae]
MLIDRSAEHFPTILNFMRDGATAPLPDDHQVLMEILAEAEYYNFEMLIGVCKEKLTQVEAERLAVLCRSVYTAEERDLVIGSGEPLIMLAFSERDEFKAEHNHEIFFRAAAKLVQCRNTFRGVHCVLDLTPKTVPGCAFDVVCGGRLVAQVPVLEQCANGGFSSVDFEKLLDRAITLLFAAIVSKLEGGQKYASDLKYLTSA